MAETIDFGALERRARAQEVIRETDALLTGPFWPTMAEVVVALAFEGERMVCNNPGFDVDHSIHERLEVKSGETAEVTSLAIDHLVWVRWEGPTIAHAWMLPAAALVRLCPGEGPRRLRF
jgi:hypothetical protein